MYDDLNSCNMIYYSLCVPFPYLGSLFFEEGLGMVNIFFIIICLIKNVSYTLKAYILKIQKCYLGKKVDSKHLWLQNNWNK